MLSETQLAIQLALGMVFLLSAASKLRNPMEFSRGVREYRVVPVAFVGPASILLIALEISLAIGHLTGFLLVVVIPLGFAALCCFAAAVSINLRRGRALPCYCFGSRNGETISTHTLVRILFLGLGELFLLGTPVFLFAARSSIPDESGPSRSSPWPCFGQHPFWS